MKYLLFFTLLSSGLWAQKQTLTQEQLAKTLPDGMVQAIPQASSWLDNDHFLLASFNEGKHALEKVNTKTGLHTAYAMEAVRKDQVRIKENDIYFVSAAGEEKRITQTEDIEKNPTLSPNNQWIAFTRNNDLYAIELATGKEIRYTSDGSDLILNAWASWVYYEEILGRASNYRSFWWSPDSKSIAYFRCDDAQVPMFPIYHASGVHGYLEQTRYPKAGDPNPKVKVGIVPVKGGATVWADFNQDDDQYFGTPYWTPDGSSLLVQWMNRDQNHLVLYQVSPVNGIKKAVYKEEQKSWIKWIDDLTFTAKGFLLTRDFDGWTQIYHWGFHGEMITKVTQGQHWATKVLRVDEKNKKIYYTSRSEISTRFDFYVSDMDGQHRKRLSFGPYSHANIILSPDARYFLTTYSNAQTPARLALVELKSGKMKELANAKGPKFEDYKLSLPEIAYLTLDNGMTVPAEIVWPVDLDEKGSYPAIVSIYGGPDAGSVMDTWKGLRNQWWANNGVIQIAIDHRGSGHCGKNGLVYMHRSLGEWEMKDYIAWMNWLQKKPFLNKEKVGITGFSYGGYISALAVMAYGDYFPYGIAGGGVYDWMLYDSHYTERFMDHPKDNPNGYNKSEALNYVKSYNKNGRSMLRLVHGTTDDNVHVQNTIQLVELLQKENLDFEMMLYPEQRHGIGGAQRAHYADENMIFWYKYLLDREAPKVLLNRK